MASIKSKNTIPELIVRKYLFSKGFRFRLHRKDLPGKPDIVLPKYRIVIFVHGCFWHQHEQCKRATIPTSNKAYWGPKLTKNKLRDQINIENLSKLGWKSIEVWECKLKSSNMDKELHKLISKIKIHDR